MVGMNYVLLYIFMYFLIDINIVTLSIIFFIMVLYKALARHPKKRIVT